MLISTDLDRTLIFSPRAIAQLGGGRPAARVEDTERDSDAELGLVAAQALAALPPRAVLCPATSRNLVRLARLRLPVTARYVIAANGGVVLAGGVPDAAWTARIARLLATAAPAAEVRPVLAGAGAGAGVTNGAGVTAGARAGAPPPWLVRIGEPDDMCCQAIVNETLLTAAELAWIADRCSSLGWRATLTGRKLYAFPAGFGKEHAVAYVAERIERETGAVPVRLAAGDAELDRAMLAAADLAWIPAGSELAQARGSAGGHAARAWGGTAEHGTPRPRRGSAKERAGLEGGGLEGAGLAGTGLAGTVLDGVAITAEPGHAGAAEITRSWLEFMIQWSS